MKRLLFLIAVVLGFVSCSSPTKNWEKYDETPFISVEALIEMYIETGERTDRIKLEKRPEGWYINEVDYSSGDIKVTRSRLAWDFEKASYEPWMEPKSSFGTKKRRSEIKSITRSIIGYGGSRNYRVNLFYGYDDYYSDVIQVFKGADLDVVPLKLLYSYGRSLGDKGTTLLSDRFLGSKEISGFDKNYILDDVPKWRIDSSKFYSQSAKDVFRLIGSRDSNFHTIIGNIKNKEWNESIQSRYDLMVLGADVTDPYYNEEAYDDYFIGFATNLLNSCEKNGVIITGGDMDTFPLIYAQEILGVRKDVVLINSSLLNLHRYFHYLTVLLPEDKRLDTDLPEEVFKRREYDFFYFDKSDTRSDRVIDFGKLKELLGTNPTRFEFGTGGGGNKLLRIPSKRIRMVVGSDTLQLTDRSFGSYLSRSQFQLMDLITANPDRKFYFSKTVGSSTYKAFDGQLRDVGMSQRLDVGLVRSDVDTAAVVKNILVEFDKKGIDKSVLSDSSKIRMNSAYMSHCLGLTMKMDAENSLKLLDMAESIYQSTGVPSDIDLNFASIYFQKELNDQGRIHCSNYLHYCEEQLSKGKVDPYGKRRLESLKAQWRSALDQNQIALIDELQAKFAEEEMKKY